MKKKIENIIINKNSRLLDAIKKINSNTFGICFVVDKNKKIIGSISDGDIRKKILRGVKMNIPVVKVMNKKVKSAHYLSNSENIFKLLNNKIKIIPLVNDKKIIIDFVSFHSADKISLIKPDLKGNELKYLTRCINTGWVSSQGEYINKFENKFSKFTKLKNALAVSNGTVALQLAISTFNIGHGDEVIVPDLTFASPVNAIIHAGAKPVLVDVKKNTFCMDENKIENAITKKTKAIIVVHLYGHPAEMSKILKICKKRKIIIIEDCAEALGSKYKNKHVGSFGDAATFSFFGNKTITTGEGGIVCFKSKKFKEKANILRDHGMSKKTKYWHLKIGYNFRMTNLQAAVGTAQFERATMFLRKKFFIVKNYKKYLQNEKDLIIPKNYGPVRNSYWLYTLTLKGKLKLDRDKIINYLWRHGIESRKVFYPISKMPIYKAYVKKNNIINSQKLHESSLSLPSSGINLKQIKNICFLVKRYIENKVN